MVCQIYTTWKHSHYFYRIHENNNNTILLKIELHFFPIVTATKTKNPALRSNNAWLNTNTSFLVIKTLLDGYLTIHFILIMIILCLLPSFCNVFNLTSSLFIKIIIVMICVSNVSVSSMVVVGRQWIISRVVNSKKYWKLHRPYFDKYSLFCRWRNFKSIQCVVLLPLYQCCWFKTWFTCNILSIRKNTNVQHSYIRIWFNITKNTIMSNYINTI